MQDVCADSCNFEPNAVPLHSVVLVVLWLTTCDDLLWYDVHITRGCESLQVHMTAKNYTPCIQLILYPEVI